MSLTLFAILALATWRLSSLVSRERGFYGWALRLRDLLENVWPERLRCNECFPRLARLCREIYSIMNCVWCVSRPIGLLFAIGAKMTTGITLFEVLVLALALSGVASLLDEVETWLEQARPQY